MKEDLRERADATAQFAGAAPLIPVPPEIRTRRRWLVRIFGLLTVVTTIGLSAIPQPGRVKSITTHAGPAGTSVVVTHDRAYGFPFNTGSGDIGSRGEIKSLTLHPEGVLGNLAIAMTAYGVLMFLLGRRRRDA